jgi:hypothetical protein
MATTTISCKIVTDFTEQVTGTVEILTGLIQPGLINRVGTGSEKEGYNQNHKADWERDSFCHSFLH